jgi:hypothetical protein
MVVAGINASYGQTELLMRFNMLDAEIGQLHPLEANQAAEQMIICTKAESLQKKQHKMYSTIILNDHRCYFPLECLCCMSGLLTGLLQNCLSLSWLGPCVLSAVALHCVLLSDAYGKYSSSRKCCHEFKVP